MRSFVLTDKQATASAQGVSRIAVKRLHTIDEYGQWLKLLTERLMSGFGSWGWKGTFAWVKSTSSEAWENGACPVCGPTDAEMQKEYDL